MREAPHPSNEERRIEALHAYQILDTEPERDFDDLTHLASLLCGTPICLVSLVDSNRQWFKSREGLEATETPRNVAFCSHAILEPHQVLVVPDALLDQRFDDNPLVTEEPRVRFYAGAPLVDAQGYALGTLCVIDHVPRSLDANQVLALQVLARQVVSQIELRKHCSDLAAASKNAEAATEAKSEFLANMSHELRTPMNALLGMAELLEDSPLTKDQREYVRVFQTAGQSLLELINDILDLSKVEAGHLTLHDESFPIRPFLESTLEFLALTAHQKDLSLTLHIGEDVPDVVVSDSARLRQVLINLIGNAIKFTEKGSVELRLERTVEGHEHWLEWSVSDTGIGISAEAQQRLFQPFTQVDSSAGRRYGGTGLGLHLSRRLVELMGGALAVESKEGVGSRFYFRLGMAPDEAVPQETSQRSRWRGIQVLLVDDNQGERQMIRRLLDQLGCLTVEATSGADALKRHGEMVADGRMVDVVLMDARMPGPVSGWKAVVTEGLERCTIMLLPANHRRGDTGLCRSMGMAGHLLKPIQRQALLDSLDQALGRAPNASTPEVRCAAEAPSVPPLRILLTDDSKDNRYLIQQFLRGGHHKIDMAETAEEALKKFRAGNYDVVLMDMQLPGMDGYAATQAIRDWETHNERARTPVLALTADAMTEDRDRALQAGCDEHVAKPIARQTLLAALARHAPPADEDANADQTLMDDDLAALRPRYLENRRADLASLREALQHSDLETMQRLGHNMKGTGASYGLPGITEIGSRIEVAAESGDAPAAFHAVEELDHHLRSYSDAEQQSGV